MFYKNARIFASDFSFRQGAFSVEGGRFASVFPDSVPEDAIDLKGATVIPGLVDIHIHGAVNEDFSSGDYVGIGRMAAYLARQGVTAFTPAAMSLPFSDLEAACRAAKRFREDSPAGCARLMGVRMEGPFLSEAKKGAQSAAYLKAPDFDAFKRLYDDCQGLIRMVDIAPELSGAISFITRASRLCTVSVAHTNADYCAARDGFAAGASHLTHLYNAMPAIHHRAPGVIPAAVESPTVRAELICDGLHSHPAMARLAFSMFGPERMVLISDALSCCGMPEGQYRLGGQEVSLRGGLGKLRDGTMAGSATNLFECMKNAIIFGIPECDAIRAATYTPACAIGAGKEIGMISPGRQADFIVCRSDFSGKRVFIAGAEI